MARSGIHYEDVKDAAETLMGRGLPPYDPASARTARHWQQHHH
jgi:hypothetical protein